MVTVSRDFSPLMIKLETGEELKDLRQALMVYYEQDQLWRPKKTAQQERIFHLINLLDRISNP